MTSIQSTDCSFLLGSRRKSLCRCQCLQNPLVDRAQLPLLGQRYPNSLDFCIFIMTSDYSSGKTLAEVVQQLTFRGCPDLTDQLDLDKCSEIPYLGGSFGDIWHGKLQDGGTVAVKCLRWYSHTPHGDEKLLKVCFIVIAHLAYFFIHMVACGA